MNNINLGRKPINKIYASSAGAAGGSVLAVLISFFYEKYFGEPLPAEVAAAMGVVLATTGSFVSGYLVKLEGWVADAIRQQAVAGKVDGWN